ncbi:ribosome biogenesis protein bop1 [Tachysurus ichikawai]
MSEFRDETQQNGAMSKVTSKKRNVEEDEEKLFATDAHLDGDDDDDDDDLSDSEESVFSGLEDSGSDDDDDDDEEEADMNENGKNANVAENSETSIKTTGKTQEPFEEHDQELQVLTWPQNNPHYFNLEK